MVILIYTLYITNLMRKKILYIITKSDVGGAQKYVSDLAANLDKSLFETKIICGGKNIRWLSNKVWLWFLFINDWLAIAEIVKLLKKERPDIIHLNSSKAGVIGSLAAFFYNSQNPDRGARTKVVFTAHGWVFNPTNALSRTTRWFYIALHKFASLFQDTIICVSEYDYNLAQNYGIMPKQKLATIHNGIDADIKFLDKKTARKELLKKLPMANSRLLMAKQWIGSIGRLVKEKNYETFICSAANIPDAFFFIIGDGPEYKNLQKEIEKNKLSEKFFLISPTGADALFLKAFDLFVMSSVKEGFPYILLEAMAAELPIVVTETGGIPEIINDHQNGLMVSQKNPELLAKAVNGLIKNKPVADKLSKTAKKILKEKFNLEKMVNKTAGIYREL